MCLPDEAIEDITYKNFERRVGTKPKPINKDALKAYYAKYKHLMTEKDIAFTDEVFAKFVD
jgi:predicted GTPase